jgi:hypothetical protein
MDKKEAVTILKNHNLWRRNQDDVNPYEMGNPTELGKAIDYAVEALEEPVAWLHIDGDSTCTNNTKKYGGVDKGYSIPLYTKEQL